MITIKYFVKSNGHTLMARIRYNGSQLTDMSTKLKITGKGFDFNSGRFPSGEYELNKQINNFESMVYGKLDNIIKIFNEEPPADVLVTALKSESKPLQKDPATFVTLSWMIPEYEKRLKEGRIFNAKTGNPLAYATVVTLVTTCTTLFSKFLKTGYDINFSKYNVSTISLLGKSVVHREYATFIHSFKSFLTNKNLSEYTIFKSVYKMKQMIKYFCKEEGIEIGGLLDDMKFGKVKREVEVISSDQIKFIINNLEQIRRDCKNSRERDVVDYLYIGIMLNQRRGDMNLWTSGNLYTIDGTTWLKFKPHKTINSSGIIVDIPLPEPVLNVFNRNIAKFDGRLLPPLDISINKKIKRIAARYPIFHNEVQVFRKGQYVKVRQCDAIHIHQMRASGASDKLMHMPEAVVREWTGHTHDSEAFARYVKVAQKSKQQFAEQYFKTS